MGVHWRVPDRARLALRASSARGIGAVAAARFGASTADGDGRARRGTYIGMSGVLWLVVGLAGGRRGTVKRRARNSPISAMVGTLGSAPPPLRRHASRLI